MTGARDQGSELYSSPALHGEDGQGPIMVLAFPPSAFLKPDSLRNFLLRELLHVTDMLDPGFGYRPSLPDALAEDRARAELVRDRFRVLWEARIAGLLARASDPLATLPSMPDHFRRAFGPSASLTKLAERYAAAWSSRNESGRENLGLRRLKRDQPGTRFHIARSRDSSRRSAPSPDSGSTAA